VRQCETLVSVVSSGDPSSNQNKDVVEKLDSFDDTELEKYAKDLCLKFPDDLNMFTFVNEVKYLKFKNFPFLKDDKLSELGPLDILNILYIIGLESAFPNTETALRIFLTLPVTVASNWRAFSKLNLIKNYLRSQMCQERLNLAIISIEQKLAEMLDFNDVIHIHIRTSQMSKGRYY